MVSDPRRQGGPTEPPSSEEARQRAEENIEAQLALRGVRVFGSESDDELLELIDAAERFDATRRNLGGDSMTNTPESSRPDDPAMVIPQRRDDEGARAYAARIRAAAAELRKR